MTPKQEKEAVVLVHGLFMNGWEMAVLRHRLAEAGFEPLRFTHPTVRQGPSANAHALQAFIEAIETERLHFVAHSLGGLVIRYLFHLYPEQRPGRVVTLGTPHQGSRAAVRLADYDWGRLILGESFESGLAGDLPEWTGDYELGNIAGSYGLGMGRLLTRLPLPHDGTVAVRETHLPRAKDNLVLPVTHTGLLFSPEVARQVVHFLRCGRFEYATH